MHTVEPESVGFSSTRLARIDAAMQRYIDAGKIAGIQALVARRGEPAYARCFGQMDVKAGKPVQWDTLWRIYSMSKPITSVAIMMLYEEGHFQLTDPLSRFIPAFKEVKVFAGGDEDEYETVDLLRPITVHDLLTHTSGLAYGLDATDAVDKMYIKHLWQAGTFSRRKPLLQVVNALAALPLAHQPGTAWRYSVATDVLGCLVQVVSGKPFDQFLQERIFGPLGMVDTHFCVPETKIERFAANYGPTKSGGLKVIDAPAKSEFTRPTRCPSGGGGLISTAPDYMRFAQMLLNQGELDGVRLLGRKTIELMTMNHLPAGMHIWEDASSGFGLGFGVTIDQAQSKALGSTGTYGWGGAANTNFWIDPQEGLIGLLMLQFMPSGTYPVIPDFRVAVYQALVD